MKANQDLKSEWGYIPDSWDIDPKLWENDLSEWENLTFMNK